MKANLVAGATHRVPAVPGETAQIDQTDGTDQIDVEC
jgi:hypothetical protein